MLALLAAAALAAPLARTEKDPVATLIANVGVMAPDGVVAGPFDVWLAGGEIVMVERSGTTGPFPPERKIDGDGMTLLPGLVDLHVHVASTTAVPGRIHLPSARDNLEALLYAGVTTVFDLAAPLDDVERWNERVAAGAWSGPEVFGTGRPFGAPDGHPRASVHAMFPSFLVSMSTKTMAWEVADATDVDEALHAQGPNPFVKLVLDSLPPGAPAISDSAAAWLRHRTDEDGVAIVAHVGRPEDVERALALPVDLLAHSPHTGAISPDQAERLAAARIPMVPTLAVWQAMYEIDRAAPWLGPLEHEITTGPVLRDFEHVAAGKAPVPSPMAEWAHGLDRSQWIANVETLHAAGVDILVGSDSPGLGLVVGAATHRELALLAEAGISPELGLVQATWGAWRFLDLDAKNGAVEPGYEADLLLVRGDPTEDLAALADIVAVWTDGRLVERTPRR